MQLGGYLRRKYLAAEKICCSARILETWPSVSRHSDGGRRAREGGGGGLLR